MNEMTSLFGVDRKTCHRWIKEGGLRVVEKGVTPLLVMGIDLIIFLKEQKVKRRVTLEDDEFFCMKCHKPTKAKIESQKTVKTGKKIGKNDIEQIKKIGICQVCGTKLNRFLRVSQKD